MTRFRIYNDVRDCCQVLTLQYVCFVFCFSIYLRGRRTSQVYNFKTFLDRRWQARFTSKNISSQENREGESEILSFDGTPAEAAAHLYGDRRDDDFRHQYAVLRRMDEDPGFADSVHDCARRSKVEIFGES